MAIIKPPKYVRQVLFTLQSRGWPAYLVGGCVRDMLLGVRPHDWDICTGALPEQILEIFPGSLTVGLKHGTVTVRMDSHLVEVTTFRAEGDYSDHRHPDLVRFVGDLTADLSRRDFTMNAIALSADGLLADPFGGAEDIRNKLIRCVGDPAARFEEDALRMFRALRFSARLGFAIDLFSLEGIRQKAALAAYLAPERIREELEKLLLTDAPETMFELMELGLLDHLLQKREGDAALFDRLRRLPKRKIERWAGFCLILLRSGCILSVQEFLSALRMDNRSIRLCALCAELLASPLPEDSRGVKRLLKKNAAEGVLCAALVQDALYGGRSARLVKQVLKSGECYCLEELAISGRDLLALGMRGPDVGVMLDFLLEYVIEYPANNRRELLLALAAGSEE